MAQKRMISKRLTDSDKIIALRGNDRARFIYTALLPHTDKSGRVNVNPMGLKGTIFEAFEYTTDDIGQALMDLAAVGLVRLYATERHQLLAQYERFEAFNKPHTNEAASNLPGPDDDVSHEVTPSGNLPGNLPKELVEGSSPTPTNTLTKTKDLSRARDQATQDLEDSSEARFTRLAQTGDSEHAQASRTRSAVRRIAGTKIAREYEADMPAWSRHSPEQIQALWDASNPDLWRGEEKKRRSWIFADLMNEDRHPPNTKTAAGRSLSDLFDLIGATGMHNGNPFEVIAVASDQQQLLTRDDHYLTPQEVEVGRACLMN